MRKFLAAALCGLFASAACAQTDRFVEPNEAYLDQEIAILREAIRHATVQRSGPICVIALVAPPPDNDAAILLRSFEQWPEIYATIGARTFESLRSASGPLDLSTSSVAGLAPVIRTVRTEDCRNLPTLWLSRPRVSDGWAIVSANAVNVCGEIPRYIVLKAEERRWNLVTSLQIETGLGHPERCLSEYRETFNSDDHPLIYLGAS